jgi:hypothetical protein
MRKLIAVVLSLSFSGVNAWGGFAYSATDPRKPRAYRHRDRSSDLLQNAVADHYRSDRRASLLR